jgi:hypothetical protein
MRQHEIRRGLAVPPIATRMVTQHRRGALWSTTLTAERKVLLRTPHRQSRTFAFVRLHRAAVYRCATVSQCPVAIRMTRKAQSQDSGRDRLGSETILPGVHVFEEGAVLRDECGHFTVADALCICLKVAGVAAARHLWYEGCGMLWASGRSICWAGVARQGSDDETSAHLFLLLSQEKVMDAYDK